ncbi:hypothetical protein [Arthrobacter woluwensis]|uniref:hypothetical protein n=1 Tax=Arthrobacter woluwensis TaxID=156980 RepID=UPI0011A6CA0C|nr:hypothetical protein [Arthrobacter woluwensis]
MSLRREILVELGKLSAIIDGYTKDNNRRVTAVESRALAVEERVSALEARPIPAPPPPPPTPPSWWQIAGPVAALVAVCVTIAQLIQWE